MSNNNNILHSEATACSQWFFFLGSNLLKTNLSICEMGPSYLLDLSTALKYIEVTVMDANNSSEEAVCVNSKS